DRPDVARTAPAHAEERALAAVAVDGVGRVADVSAGAARVRRLSVHGVGERVLKVQLSGMDDVAAEVHLHVDVHRPALVPAGIDGPEGRDPFRIRPLDSAHEGATRGALSAPGIDAG